MNSIKPVVEKEDVKQVFFDLLEENEETTSLDVKNKLREMGFWATQERVTGFMREISVEENINFDFNGVYRTYFKEEQKTQTPLLNIINAAVKHVDQLDTPVEGCWEVSDGDDPAVMYFDGKMTPGQAKAAFVKLSGTDFLDARVKRYKS
jgi:DNA gyrase/topoisomerase IV subunit B